MLITDGPDLNSSLSDSSPDVVGEFPLSSAQLRLWLLSQMEGASHAYHLPLGIRLKGNLNRPALASALDRILARHEVLRTTFAFDRGVPLQRIASADKSRFRLVEHDLHLNPDAAAELETITKLEVDAPFDLAVGPLIRGRLIRLSEHEHVLLITMHHIVSDGWSIGILIRELSSLYGAFAGGETDPLPELDLQYADYSAWQQQWLEGDLLKQQAAFWKNALAGAPSLLEVPTDHPRPAQQDYVGDFAKLELDKELTSQLKDFSRRHGVTLFMTLLAAWAALLGRLSGQQDVLIGITAANRERAEVEGLIGFFVNTLVVRLDLSGSPSTRQLLEQVKRQLLTALEHQDIPFEKVVDLVQPERNLAHSPLFQVMFAWQNFAPTTLDLPGMDAQFLPLPYKKAPFDLTFYLQETSDVVFGGLEYATSLFESETIARQFGYYCNLLQAMIADDSMPVECLNLLADSERHRLLYEWNDTAAEYPKFDTLAQIIEQHAEQSPDAIAVVYGNQRLSYRELNVRANRLARELSKLGACSGQVVGLYVERSADLIVALLAISKTGAAYLPLDPLFPPERLAYMIGDSGTQLLLTQRSLRKDLSSFSGNLILLDGDVWQSNSDENLAVSVEPEALGYLIYTSGSTGKPKGVQVSQGALRNFLWSMREWLQLSERDRLLAVTTISFDIAGLEIWLPLLVGAQVVLASHEEAMNGGSLRVLIDQHNITIMQATPVTWRLLFEAGWTGKPGMQVICGGEAMPPELAMQLTSAVDQAWNLYGPTETTIWSTGYKLNGALKEVLIGRPLANTQCYILDAQLQPVPIGVTGELYIGGDGVAQGYLNRPELTAEKFISNPFHGNGSRMYRTGDLARYRSDGNIECLGRIDHQVKIRGYRIELGEIEAVLESQPEIDQAVVVVREDIPGDRRLTAYYVPSLAGESQENVVSAEQLRLRLSASLPVYMVPAAYICLKSLPLTPNGKLNRNALPSPEAGAYTFDRYEPPIGEMEIKLATIWAEVLKIDRVGRRDNFFNLGGHSLLAVQLILGLQQIIPGEPLPLRAILEAPTVELLAAWIDRNRESHQQILVQVKVGSSKRKPFFCVHGAGGNVLSLRPLAEAMPADLPVYFLEAKGLDGSEPFESVEETAQCYVEEIRRVQPHGPYQLGGGCYGGLVAFEMARILAKLGEPVAALIMIDISNPAFASTLSKTKLSSRTAKFLVRRARVHSARIASMPIREWPGFLKGRFKALDKNFQRLVRKPAEVDKTEFQTDPDWESAKSIAGTRLGEILERVGRASRIAGRKFVPGTYDGDALIVVANEYKVTPLHDDYLGWRPVVKGTLERVIIEGDHKTIFEQPAVRAMAEAIDAKLRGSLAEI